MSSVLANRVRDDAPDDEVLTVAEHDGREASFGREKCRPSASLDEPLHGQIPVNGSDDDVAVPRLRHAVDHEEVPIKDAVSDHRVPLGPDVERRGRVGPNVHAEVERTCEAVIGG